MKDNSTTNFACAMQEALVSYLYNEATPSEAVAVEAHLNECAACSKELQGFEAVREMLQQWRTDELPVLTIRTEQGRPFFALLREVLTRSPLWLKSGFAVATVALLLSVIGMSIQISRDGISVQFGLFGSKFGGTEVIQKPNTADGELKEGVARMIADSERQQRAELGEQLMKLEAALQGSHTSELNKLAARVREQRAKLDGLERDIDRREGLDITNLLFSASARQGSEGQ